MTASESLLKSLLDRLESQGASDQEALIALDELEGKWLSGADLFVDASFRLRPGVSSKTLFQDTFREVKRTVQAQHEPLVSKLLHDVEVTGEGFLVAGKRGVLAESTYLNPKTRAGFGRVFVGHPAPALTRLSDEVLWIVGSSGPSRNYWHWTAQVLPAVLHGIESVESEFGFAEWKILTRSLEPYQRESLDILGISPNQIREVSASEIVRVPNLLYSSYLVEPWTPGSHRMMLADRLRTLTESSERHDRLFVSRRDSRRRRVLNEEELERFLVQRGFVTVVPGGLPWRVQVDLFQSATVIVGAHGAGLANLLFCHRGTKVLELGLDTYPSAADVVLGASSGLDYWMDFFPGHTATSRHLASVTIDTEVVESSLNDMGVT